MTAVAGGWRRWAALLLWLGLGLWAGPVAAHEMTIAEMQMREVAPGEFLWQWTASEKRPAEEDLTPHWPEGCSAEPGVLHCGAQGLKGALTIEGVGQRYSAAMVKVWWHDGGSRVYTFTKAQPTVHLFGSADDRRGLGEIAAAYLVLGVEHILTGYDHLLFVLGLLFLVGFERRLVKTITAFTAAHSVTLALSALGWLTLRPAPVEATIALSIMLVAGEALHTRDTLSRRWPAMVAFLFGLVHGLGFAGALKEIGLPEQHLAIALLTFNLGVEAGQLLVVGAAYLLYRLVRSRPAVRAWRTPLLYGIGTMAAFWTFERVQLLLWQGP